MLSLKDPKQMFSENEDIVLEQRATVQVNRARVSSIHGLVFGTVTENTRVPQLTIARG